MIALINKHKKSLSQNHGGVKKLEKLSLRDQVLLDKMDTVLFKLHGHTEKVQADF